MAELTYRDAMIRGIAQEMERDNRVVFLGEDVGKAGGVFKATVGLYEKFGPLRVRDTPISEQAILGAAMGAAMTGLRPIAEIIGASSASCSRRDQPCAASSYSTGRPGGRRCHVAALRLLSRLRPVCLAVALKVVATFRTDGIQYPSCQRC